MQWLVVAAVFAAFVVGVYVGWRWHQWSLLRALRSVAPRIAEPAPIDHDAMLRIIKEHQHE